LTGASGTRHELEKIEMKHVLMGTLVLILIPGGFRGHGDPPQLVCKKTEMGDKCGTDVVLSWVMCGDPPTQCNIQEEIYELLFNCVGAARGKSDCVDQPCRKRTIIRACEDGACVFKGDDYEDVVMGEVAGGESCPSLPRGHEEW
jgi:hypothetical protein